MSWSVSSQSENALGAVVRSHCRFGTGVVVAVCGLMLSTTAQARGGVILLIVPQPRIIAPPVYRPQPPALTVPNWMPPLPAPGPSIPPPPRRCYAGTRVCALEQPNTPTNTCTCRTAFGSAAGRALIPPSRHFGPQPAPDR
jgi:hypothetical protein